MNYKSFWIFFACLAFLLCIVLSKSFYRDYEVYYYGNVCKVVIKSLPGGGQTTGGFMYFYKDDQVYFKKVNGNYGLLHQVGDTIELKYLEKFNGHFLFKNEDPIAWGVFTMIMMIGLGIACLNYAFKKEPPIVKLPWQKKP
jgi:hypothetical protein